MTPRETASHAIADWLAEFDYGSLPVSVKLGARKALINSVGTAIGGYPIDSTQRVIRYAKQQSGSGDCTVLVDGSRLSSSMAVFANGVMVNALGQEETHVASSTHPAQTTVPIVLAVGERLERSGEEVLAALIAGMEVTAAISCMKLTPAVKLDRCHAPAVFGTIGAAAAAARLVGLDVERTAHALGLAANFAAGLSEGSRAGTGEYHYLKGLVGMHALMAVDLAADGAVAAPLAFEGPGGFYHTFAGASTADLAAFDVPSDLRSLLEGEWITPELMYKPYPANFFNIPFIDAARVIRHERGVGAGDIRRVHVGISEYAANSGGALRPPYTHRGNALASTAFGVGCMLARGHVDPADTLAFDAPDIAQMCERIEVEVTPDLHGGALEVITATDSYSVDLDQTLTNYYLGESEVRDIARVASATVFSAAHVDELLSELDGLEHAPSVRGVLRLAVEASGADVKNRKEELLR
jgi:2-methylcitrate dehydratase PrpD